MYETLFSRYLYPLYETRIKGRNTLNYLKAMTANQWKSPEELRSLQWQALEKLLAHAYRQSPFYRRAFEAAGLVPEKITGYDDFSRLPVLSREDIVAHKQEMIARDQADTVIHKSTGGSTGVPVQFAISRDSNEWRTAAAYRGYQWANCGPGQPTVYIWGVDVGKPTAFRRFKTGLYHRAFNRIMFNCFDFTEDEMRRCLATIKARRPNGIVAFTSAVYNLARFAADNGITDCTVPAVITGAEKLHDYQRETIESAFHTRVFNTYGCREFMLIAAECEKHEGLHVTVDNIYVEILNDGKPAAPGEAGDVVITDLHNYGMPFIRYRNGDIAIQGEAACSCGRGLPLIRDVSGRTMDEIVATSGKVVSGGFFPHLMKEFDAIDKYQVIQKAGDAIVLKLALKEPLSETQLTFCQDEIRKVLGKDMAIQIDLVDDIPLTRTGKYRTTISEIRQS